MLDPETELLTYQITDWVMERTGDECLKVGYLYVNYL